MNSIGYTRWMRVFNTKGVAANQLRIAFFRAVCKKGRTRVG